MIDARELPQQVADVGADAEVVELPRVDRDSHALPILHVVGLWALGFWAVVLPIPAAPVHAMPTAKVSQDARIHAALPGGFAAFSTWARIGAALL